MADLLILNANTSPSTTRALDARARELVHPETRVCTVKPSWGPRVVRTDDDARTSEAAILDRVACREGPADVLVLAGFGARGSRALQKRTGIPVVDMTEAGVAVASMLGTRCGIVTTVRTMIGPIETSLAAAGCRWHGIEALDLEGPEIATGSDTVTGAFDQAVTRLLAQGADVICLGGAAFTEAATRLTSSVSVPVVDAFAAAVGLAEACARSRWTGRGA